MNIFSFTGKEIMPFLEQCPIHPVRNEKELPEAVRFLVKRNSKAMRCFAIAEKLPDLTSAEDIAQFFS